MKTLYIAYPLLFSNFLQPPLPCRLQPSPPLLIRLCCLFGWMSDRATFDRLFYLMISWMYTCRALVPWCMFYATRRQIYWVLTRDVVFCLSSDLITHTHTHTHKDTQHTQGPVDWHAHINIYLHQLLCAHSSYLYFIKWIMHWYQQFTFHNFFFINYSLVKVIYICWLDAIRLSSSCEAKIILIEMV